MPEDQEILEEVEENAREQLGVERWDRPEIYREAASAGTDTHLTFWLVLIFSGAIATLGLALDSSAVVIGAMLIAPLLAPVVGLAMALAVGDGRLALQTFVVILVSTVAVIATGALLTLALPFRTVTPEISARVHPTALDLVIAVFSGLAGAVVTVARENRLSASIPGVAIAVALIPPLGVAGFGLGMGNGQELLRGSLLLYGANLAGIVLSGMLIFIMIGMHRREVFDAARQWHQEDHPRGLVKLLNRGIGMRGQEMLGSAWARVALVSVFVVVLAIPLGQALKEAAREARVHAAVGDTVEELFQQPGRSSVVSRQVVMSRGRTQVFVRVATTRWFGQEVREEFTRRASEQAGEPVRLVLEQLPARSGELEQLTDLLSVEPRPAVPPPPPGPTRLPNLISAIRGRLSQAVETLPLPNGVEIAGMELAVHEEVGSTLHIGYVAASPLDPESVRRISSQIASAIGDRSMRVELLHISPESRSLEPGSLAEVRDLMRRFQRLRAVVAVEEEYAGLGRVAIAQLVQGGISEERVALELGPGGDGRVRLNASSESVGALDSIVVSNPQSAERSPR